MKQKLNYKQAGVDIELGNEIVHRIKKSAETSRRPEVIGDIGGFAGLFDIQQCGYQHPVLVSSTDGVGTKLKLAIEAKTHAEIGTDLVAMCVNDLIVKGAEPLFFLDYFACSALDIKVVEEIISGIITGCKLASCSLIGGETAEMPGMYASGEYDLAGFSVGVVERHKIISGNEIAKDDVLIGIASSGCHANGYSLIRAILVKGGHQLTAKLAEKTLAEELLTPTRIYVKAILGLLNTLTIKGISHITGGGLLENIPRILPRHLAAKIDRQSWEMPEIFQWIQKQGNLDQHSMLQTFNCGVGMVICVDRSLQNTALEYLQDIGETSWVIGKVVTAQAGRPSVLLS